jgi:prepilin-type N-terminal cleavage/methylation domain-containing protein
MQRGFSLTEMVVACLILGVVLAISWPSFSRTRDRLVVAEWATALASAHARARTLALVEQRVALITVAPDSLVLRIVTAGGDTAERWRSPGPASDGVSLGTPPHTTSFAPSGLAFGLSNVTYTLSRGAALKQVVVSRYGRVRIP